MNLFLLSLLVTIAVCYAGAGAPKNPSPVSPVRTQAQIDDHLNYRGVAAAAPGFAKVDMGVAGEYALLAGAAITNNGNNTAVTGKIGVSPGTSLTGFGPGKHTLPAVKNLGDGAASTAQGALLTAYGQATTQGMTELLSNQDLGGMYLPCGVYKFGVAASLIGELYLDAEGQADASWTFQIGSAMLFTYNSRVTVINGAPGVDYGNAITWAVGSSATIMADVHVEGSIIAYASITSTANSEVNGRLLALNAAVTLIQDVVKLPCPTGEVRVTYEDECAAPGPGRHLRSA